MTMRKWLISAVTLTLALSTAGAVTAFALAGGGSGNDDATNMAGEVIHGDPTYEEWLSNYKPTKVPVTSIDDIDPNVCNLIHNINACTPEELEEGFGALTDIASEETHGRTEPAVVGAAMCSLDVPNCTDMLVVTQDEGGEIEPGFEVEGSSEPLFVDGEPGYRVQPLNDAIVEDCGLAGGTAYVTSDGEVGCVLAPDLEDSGDKLVSSSQPPAAEPQPAPDTQ